MFGAHADTTPVDSPSRSNTWWLRERRNATPLPILGQTPAAVLQDPEGHFFIATVITVEDVEDSVYYLAYPCERHGVDHVYAQWDGVSYIPGEEDLGVPPIPVLDLIGVAIDSE